MAQSPRRPLWRMAVDSADKILGPASEQLVRTDAFADVVGMATRMQHAALKQTQRALREQWHRWNLPAGTDVRRLSEQVASLERQGPGLTRPLEDRSMEGRRRDARAELDSVRNAGNGSARAAAGRSTTSAKGNADA